MWLVFLLAVSTANAAGQPRDWSAVSRDASSAMRSREFGRAVSLYRELTHAFPENARLAMNLALALHSAGDYPQAVRQLQSVVKLDAGLGPAWFLLGVDLQKLKRPEEAVEALKQSLTLDAGNAAARLEYGDALLQTGRFQESAAQFRSLTVADTENTRAWLGLGLSYASVALEAFDALRQLFPGSAFFHMLAGQSQMDQNQYRSAYGHFRQALQLDPALTDAHIRIAAIYRLSGHPEWAAAEEQKLGTLPGNSCDQQELPCLFSANRYDEVLARAGTGKTPESYYWQARAYTELAREAHVHLGQLPPSAEMHQLLAVMYEMRGLYPDSIQEWRNALRFQPDNAKFKRKLARALFEAGESKAALEQGRELLRANANDRELHLLVGDALLKMQLPEQAVDHLKKAVSLAPGDLSAHASLANAFLQQGHFKDAIPHLEAALPLDRGGAIRYQLAQAYRNTGQGEKAAAQLRISAQERAAARKVEEEITPP